MWKFVNTICSLFILSISEEASKEFNFLLVSNLIFLIMYSHFFKRVIDFILVFGVLAYLADTVSYCFLAAFCE